MGKEKVFVTDPIVIDQTEDFKVRFECLQQCCDMLSDLVNNFEWSVENKNQLIYTWTQLIRVYWSLCQTAGIKPLPKL